MRSFLKSVSLLVTVAAVLVGCTSAEQKLGRGLDNLSEPFRLGELQRSYEQGLSSAVRMAALRAWSVV